MGLLMLLLAVPEDCSEEQLSWQGGGSVAVPTDQDGQQLRERL
jgi:hypothetical protein